MSNDPCVRAAVDEMRDMVNRGMGFVWGKDAAFEIKYEGRWEQLPMEGFFEASGKQEEKVYSRSEQLQRTKEILGEAAGLLDPKGNDYATEFDLFSAFRFVGYVMDFAIRAGVTGVDLSFFALMAVKLVRLITLAGGVKRPENESVRQTCEDLANYAALYAAMLECPGMETPSEYWDSLAAQGR